MESHSTIAMILFWVEAVLVPSVAFARGSSAVTPQAVPGTDPPIDLEHPHTFNRRPAADSTGAKPASTNTAVAEHSQGPTAELEAPPSTSGPPPPLLAPHTTDSIAPDTIIPKDAAIGAFLGLGASYTRFANRDRVALCLEGSMLIDHTLSLGITGCGVAPGIRTVEIDPSADPTYDTYFGYGGIQIRYSMLSHRFYSLAAGGLLGAGGTVTGNLSDSDSTSGSSSPDFVFVFEPQLAAYVTMTSWMRFGLIGSYRYAAGVDSAGLSSANVGGYTMGSQVQFGWL